MCGYVVWWLGGEEGEEGKVGVCWGWEGGAAG